MLPPLEDARKLVSGLFVELVGQITTEDAKKIRELVRNAAIRDDRKLTPRELEQVASAAEQIRRCSRPAPRGAGHGDRLEEGRGLQAHQPRARRAARGRARSSGEDAELLAAVETKNLEKARELGNGLLGDVCRGATEDADVRELANDLCLRTDGKIQKEDLDALIQWALKVREMYLDIESRREDTREAAVDSVNRLEADLAALPRGGAQDGRQ